MSMQLSAALVTYRRCPWAQRCRWCRQCVPTRSRRPLPWWACCQGVFWPSRRGRSRRARSERQIQTRELLRSLSLLVAHFRLDILKKSTGMEKIIIKKGTHLTRYLLLNVSSSALRNSYWQLLTSLGQQKATQHCVWDSRNLDLPFLRYLTTHIITWLHHVCTTTFKFFS